ncbi:hypothetical protein D3C72_2391080 [compost metagenome]
MDDARDRRLFDRITLRGVSEDDCPRQELEWIIRATWSAELPTILTVAKETGMRRSEVVGTPVLGLPFPQDGARGRSIRQSTAARVV